MNVRPSAHHGFYLRSVLYTNLFIGLLATQYTERRLIIDDFTINQFLPHSLTRTSICMHIKYSRKKLPSCLWNTLFWLKGYSIFNIQTPTWYAYTRCPWCCQFRKLKRSKTKVFIIYFIVYKMSTRLNRCFSSEINCNLESIKFKPF